MKSDMWKEKLKDKKGVYSQRDGGQELFVTVMDKDQCFLSACTSIPHSFHSQSGGLGGSTSLMILL